MIMGYEGTIQLWEKVYTRGEKNGDLIGEKLKKIPHIELKDGKLTFNENKTLTIVKISEAPIYNGKKPTSDYRRLVRIESTGKTPKDITELLEHEEFQKIHDY